MHFYHELTFFCLVQFYFYKMEVENLSSVVGNANELNNFNELLFCLYIKNMRELKDRKSEDESAQDSSSNVFLVVVVTFS